MRLARISGRVIFQRTRERAGAEVGGGFFQGDGGLLQAAGGAADEIGQCGGRRRR